LSNSARISIDVYKNAGANKAVNMGDRNNNKNYIDWLLQLEALLHIKSTIL